MPRWANTSQSYFRFCPTLSTLGSSSSGLSAVERVLFRDLVGAELARRRTGRRRRRRFRVAERHVAGFVAAPARARSRTARPASASRLVVSVSTATTPSLVRARDPGVQARRACARIRICCGRSCCLRAASARAAASAMGVRAPSAPSPWWPPRLAGRRREQIATPACRLARRRPPVERRGGARARRQLRVRLDLRWPRCRLFSATRRVRV